MNDKKTSLGLVVEALKENVPSPRAGAKGWRWAAAALIAIVLVAWLATRGKKPAAESAARDVPVADGGLIRFSEAFAGRVGLKYAAAQEEEISAVVEVTGAATFSPKRVALVGARIAGRVRAIYKFDGDEVREGETLAEIESAELGRAQAEVLNKRAHEEAAVANEKREQRLAEDKVSSARDAELARATAAAARAERQAAEMTVRALGGDVEAGGNAGILRMRTPIAGRVVEVKITRGQMVDAQTNAFRVAELSKLWVELDVFEQQIGAVREGDKVELFALSQPNHEIRGTVAHVGDVINEETRSATVRVEVDNDKGLLRAGQGLRARIFASGPKAKLLAVPSEALTRVDGKPVVFVLRDANTVEVRKVTAGQQASAHVAITSGLTPGEQVVTHGVFDLKSEIFR